MLYSIRGVRFTLRFSLINKGLDKSLERTLCPSMRRNSCNINNFNLFLKQTKNQQLSKFLS